MNITGIQLCKRLQVWQKRLAYLGISHFRIDSVTIVNESEARSGDASASVYTHGYYDTCDFEFLDSFIADADDRQLDETIIHEWLHVAWRDLDTAIHAGEYDTMGTATRRIWSESVNHEREGLIERLARTLYDLYNE